MAVISEACYRKILYVGLQRFRGMRGEGRGCGSGGGVGVRLGVPEVLEVQPPKRPRRLDPGVPPPPQRSRRSGATKI